jgi:hypothetical protein
MTEMLRSFYYQYPQLQWFWYLLLGYVLMYLLVLISAKVWCNLRANSTYPLTDQIVYRLIAMFGVMHLVVGVGAVVLVAMEYGREKMLWWHYSLYAALIVISVLVAAMAFAALRDGATNNEVEYD